MNCGKCEKSYLLGCPECGKDIIICLEGNVSTHLLKWWDKDIGCDGVG